MFGNKVNKTIYIEGMTCGHCAKRVEDALKGIKEVKSAKVLLEDKKAEIVLKEDISSDVIKSAVEDIGFEVTNIE